MSTPTSTKLIFWADQCRAQTTNTLSVINSYNSLFVNLLTSPTGLGNFTTTALTLPFTGGYLFEIGSWVCGTGTSQGQVIVTRSGTTIYQRVRTAGNPGCSIGSPPFFWHLFQAGDIATLYANMNNTGSTTGTTTSQISSFDDNSGPIRIWFIPS